MERTVLGFLAQTCTHLSPSLNNRTSLCFPLSPHTYSSQALFLFLLPLGWHSRLTVGWHEVIILVMGSCGITFTGAFKGTPIFPFYNPKRFCITILFPPIPNLLVYVWFNGINVQTKWNAMNGNPKKWNRIMFEWWFVFLRLVAPVIEKSRLGEARRACDASQVRLGEVGD